MQVRRRNRNAVPPNFHLPPKGNECEHWLPIGQRELQSRAKLLNNQRLKVIEIIINRVILHTLSLFALNMPDISFKLDTVSVINSLITEFTNTLLSTWTGPKFRGNGWKDKKWEGKNGYYKLCKNWFDQNKWKISHTFWLPVFKQILIFINTLSHQLFTHNIPFQHAFEQCLIYACLYSICSSKVGFPKTRDLPLFLCTAIAKNTKIRKYLRELDPQLHVYKFKEEESERYNKDKKICEAVKQRCVEYLGNILQIKLNEFYKLVNICGDIGDINLNKFTMKIRYNVKGNIGRDSIIGSNNSHSNNSDNSHSDNYNNSHSNTGSKSDNDIIPMNEDDNQTQQSIPVSLSLSTSLSRVSSGSAHACDILPPNINTITPPPMDTSMESYHIAAMDNARLRSELNRLRAELNNVCYGGQHMQIRNVRQIRHNPYNYSPYYNAPELDGMCTISCESTVPIPPPYYVNNERMIHEISTESNISNNSFLSDASSVSYYNPMCHRSGYNINNPMMNPIVYNNSYACPPQQIMQPYPPYYPGNTYQNNYL